MSFRTEPKASVRDPPRLLSLPGGGFLVACAPTGSCAASSECSRKRAFLLASDGMTWGKRRWEAAFPRAFTAFPLGGRCLHSRRMRGYARRSRAVPLISPFGTASPQGEAAFPRAFSTFPLGGRWLRSRRMRGYARRSRAVPLINPSGTASRRRKENAASVTVFAHNVKNSVRRTRTPHRGDAHNARLTPQGEAFFPRALFFRHTNLEISFLRRSMIFFSRREI